MIEGGQAVFGVFLFLGGVLTAINHPVIDSFNRWVKSVGATQRSSDIEMSELSIWTGRITGTLVALFGLFLVVTAIRW
jgi:hypothetical protein